MPRPVQNRHGEVGYLPVNVPRDGTQSVGDRSVKINLPSHRGRNNQLLHVDRWPRIEHGAARRHARHADRVRKALGGERGAIDWVNRNVQSGPVPSPICSPLNSIGASSFSPSPITTTPFIRTDPSTGRMASTAA